MDSRAPRASRGTGVERQGCYRPAAVSVGPKGHVSGHSLSISGRCGERSLRRTRHAVGDIFGPDSPGQASQFIGDSNRRFVVAAPVAEGHRPVMQTTERLRPGSLALGGDEHRARPMGAQAAEVAVPVFGDPTETPAMPTGVLARGEPQPTGKLASPSEGADMPHGPDQGRRGQEPNAGNLVQAPYDRVGVGEGPPGRARVPRCGLRWRGPPRARSPARAARAAAARARRLPAKRARPSRRPAAR